MNASQGDPAIKDSKRVDLSDPEEVKAWSAFFQLSEANLRAAVALVGPMSAAVASYINSRGRRGSHRQIGELGRPFDRVDPPPSDPQ